MQRELREFGRKFAGVTRETFTMREKISEEWKVKGKAEICITTCAIIMQSNQFNSLFYFTLFYSVTISTRHQRMELCPGFDHIPEALFWCKWKACLLPFQQCPFCSARSLVEKMAQLRTFRVPLRWKSHCGCSPAGIDSVFVCVVWFDWRLQLHSE